MSWWAWVFIAVTAGCGAVLIRYVSALTFVPARDFAVDTYHAPYESNRAFGASVAPLSVVPGAGELNGVGELLQAVIEEKLEEGSYKQRQFKRMNLNVLLLVRDVGQSVTMDFQRGRAIVSTGAVGKADMKVECDNETVTQFTCFTLLPGGLPNFFDANGRSIVAKLLTRRLVIRGLIRHLVGLVLFIRLFSIPRDEA